MRQKAGTPKPYNQTVIKEIVALYLKVRVCCRGTEGVQYLRE